MSDDTKSLGMEPVPTSQFAAWPPKYWHCPNDSDHSIQFKPRWSTSCDNLYCLICADTKAVHGHGTKNTPTPAPPSTPHSALPEPTVYKKVLQDDGAATPHYMIVCVESWRESIVCTGMYGWAADWLVEQLQGKPYPEYRGGGVTIK